MRLEKHMCNSSDTTTISFTTTPLNQLLLLLLLLLLLVPLLQSTRGLLHWVATEHPFEHLRETIIEHVICAREHYSTLLLYTTASTFPIGSR